jgi:hypothetical protein
MPADTEVFHSSCWIPAEWIKAHGLEPRALWARELGARGGLSVAEGVCPYSEELRRFAQRAGPAAVVFTTACDQTRRAFDAAHLNSLGVFLFNTPAACESRAAADLYRAEVERLGRFLVSLGGRPPARSQLAGVMLEYAEKRKTLARAWRSMPAIEYANAIGRFCWDGSSVLPPRASEGWAQDLVPLALVGGPLPASSWILLDELEKGGGRVVLNATETGERMLLPVFDEDRLALDPFGALVDGYWGNCVDVFQRPNRRLYAWIESRLIERGARGLVLWHYVACDLWRAEAQSLREAFGLPVLALDAVEDVTSDSRDLTRLRAFLEMLR